MTKAATITDETDPPPWPVQLIARQPFRHQGRMLGASAHFEVDLTTYGYDKAQQLIMDGYARLAPGEKRFWAPERIRLQAVAQCSSSTGLQDPGSRWSETCDLDDERLRILTLVNGGLAELVDPPPAWWPPGHATSTRPHH
jgi:hypothetical protein